MKKEIIRQLTFISKNKKEIKQFLEILSFYANEAVGKQVTGRPRIKMYKVIAGILYYNKSGCTWELLPRVFGSYKTIFGWYSILSDKKLFESTWKDLLHKAIDEGLLKVIRIIEDGSLVSCASRNGLAKHHPRNRNKLTINNFIGTNQDGMPLNFRVMSGSTHDIIAFKSTTHEIVKEFNVKPNFNLHADKAFDSKSNRKFVSELGGISNIPHRDTGRWKGYKNPKDRFRFVVERTIAWSKSYKALKNIFIKRPNRIKEMHCLFFNIILLRLFARNKKLYLICGG